MKNSIPVMSLLAALLTACIPAVVHAGAPASVAAADQQRAACGSLQMLKAKIHMAIYSALKYPASMAFFAARGITTVKYVYRDGQAGDVRVSESSGNRILDRAALRAVREAKYPSAPAAFHGIKIPDVVYFVFDNSDLMARDDAPTNSGSALRRQLYRDEQCIRK
ncbi:MAG: TonB family protein [Gammaproteobacteria bacterium]|nr:TonB family protein [Gammaproteobacteria bacterium]